MSQNIILLGGYSAAGKTTLAQSISKKYGLHFIEHKRIGRTLAEAHGYARAREWLLASSLHEVLEESLDAMIKEIGEHPEGVVLDIVYSEAMCARIRETFPAAKVTVIYVDTPREQRLQRIMQRMDEKDVVVAEAELNFRDSFLFQAGIDSLRATNDSVIISPDGCVEETAAFVWNHSTQI